MFILHGTWFSNKDIIPGKFGFWGETTSFQQKGKKAYTKYRKDKKCQEHPFQVNTKEVLSLLQTMTSSFQENEQPEMKTVLFHQRPLNRWRSLKMPTLNMIPASSQEFISEDTSLSSCEKKLRSWKVCHVELSATDALLWLARFPEKQTSSILGNTVGEDVRFWSATAKFGLELLARQRFLPSVVDQKNSLHARWIPVFNDPRDAERMTLLATSMPPVCLAEVASQQKTPRDLITDFLTVALDETIRMWLFNHLDMNFSWRNRLLGGNSLISLWFNGLSSPSHTRIRCTSHQEITLQESLGSWMAGIQQQGEYRRWRVCFRLEEPGGETDMRSPMNDWRLTYHLQDSEDKSLLVPMYDFWKNRSKTIPFVNEQSGHPEDRFLEDLVHASRLYSPIEQSLRTNLPTECTIDTQQAYTFLKEGAWLLEECGYGVLIPSWWNYKKQQTQLGLKLKVQPPKQKPRTSPGFFSLDHLVDFQWEVAIGDDTLNRTEFERLAQLKTPLVRIRGKWVELSKEDITAAMNFLTNADAKGLTLAESLRVGIGHEDVGLPVVGFHADGWIADFIGGGEQAAFAELAVSNRFNGVLRPYQIRGFSWLSFLRDRGMGACLADDMGLGKTIELIALLLHEKCKKHVNQPVLLICPTSVVGNWKRELERFAPSLQVMVHHGSERRTGRGFVAEARRHDLVISTYALAYRDEPALKKIKWTGVVLDEAQNIKNPWTKQTQAIRRLPGGYRIALTGTPVENCLDELWSIMEFLNPGYLGSLKEFKRRFVVPIERYGDCGASEKLRRLIQPFVLRRLKTDKRIIKDLPEKLEMKVYYTLTKEQATLYQATVNDMMQQIETSEGIQRRGLVLSTLLKLKQICNHPVLFLQDESEIKDRSGKLTRFMEMLEEVLAAGDRALIFTQYVAMGKMLQDHLQSTFGREVLFLHGGTPRKTRDALIARFQQENRGPSLFILSLKAGGLGLNLTRANHVFHFDRWWNPAVENQATDRAFRIGQRKNVQVHKFVCLGTLEERIDQMLEHKKGLSERVLGAGETWLTELSNDQLRDLFTLRSEAVQNGGGER